MKLAHKRIASGIQNSSMYQNTQRIAIPKKPSQQNNPPSTQRRHLNTSTPSQQQQNTGNNKILAKRDHYEDNDDDHNVFQNGDQYSSESQQQQYYPSIRQSRYPLQLQQSYSYQSLAGILHEFDLINLYQEFIRFQMSMDRAMGEGNIVQARKYCKQFRVYASEIFQSQHQQDMGGSQQIKQLLSQIYQLRKKLSELDNSINLQSISSLDQHALIANNTQNSNRTPTLNNYTQQKYLQNIGIRTNSIIQEQYKYRDGIQQELTVNFIQLKQICFQLCCLLWRSINRYMPDEAVMLKQEINKLYALELSSLQRSYNQNSIKSSLRHTRNTLDQICYISHIAHILVRQINHQYDINSEQTG